MKQFLTNSSNKSNQNFTPTGALIVDSGVGGAALVGKLRTLPMQLIYVNLSGCSSHQQEALFVDEQLNQIQDLSTFVVMFPSQINNLDIKQRFSRSKQVCCEPPLYQARQYSATRVAVYSSTCSVYDGCQTIDGTTLASLINSNASPRQIRQQIQSDLDGLDSCDTVAFDDCIFSVARSSFWTVAPNVKFFDCADSMASVLFKNKKLRQKNGTPSYSQHFWDKTGKTEQIFNKIFQKIYKPY